MPLVQSCCFGCSLQTGSKIIGFLNLIIDTFVSIIRVYELIQTAKLATTIEQYTFLIQSCSLQLYSLVEVFLGIYLLYGLYKHQLHCIRAWVVIQVVFLTVSVCSDIILLIFHYFVIETDADKVIPVVIIMTFLHMYSILVVHSYAETLRSRESLYAI